MARYTLEIPDPTIQNNADGSSTVNTPTVAVTAKRPTPEEVQQFENEQQGRFTLLMPSAQAAETQQPEAPTGLKPTFLESVGRGMMDVGQGIKQAVMQAAEAGSSVGAGTQSPQDMISGNTPAQRYTRDVGNEVKLYEQGAGPDVDIGRLTGNVVATAPTALIPGMGAATLGPRMLAGSAGGALAGGSMFVPEGQSRFNNIASGALLGAVAPAAIEPIRKGLVNLIGKFRATPNADINLLPQALEQELRTQGINYNALSQEVKQSLLQDVANTLKTNGVVDPVQLARKADIEAVGAIPTRASLTRSPQDWQFEQNNRGIQGIGEPLAARAQTNAQKLIDYVQGVRNKTGAVAKTSYEAGQKAINAVNQSFKDSGEEVGDLYKAAREAFGGDKTIPTGVKPPSLNASLGVKQNIPESSFNQEAQSILNTYESRIPAEIVTRLKELGITKAKLTDPTRDLTVNEGEKLINLINAHYDPAGPRAEKAALDALRNNLKSALDNIAPESDAAVAFKAARQSAAERFQQFAPKNLQGITQGKITPDRFVEQKILGGPIQDLQSLKTVMQSADAQSWKDAKGIVLDNLLMKATGATSPDDAVGKAFSGVKFAKALDGIEPERLRILFDANEMNALQTLKRASKNLTEEVPFSDVNYSKTGAAIANLIQKIGNTPLIGGIAAPIIGLAKTGKDWTKDAATRKLVAEALAGKAGNQAEKLVLPIPDTKPVRFIQQSAPALLNQPSGGAND